MSLIARVATAAILVVVVPAVLFPLIGLLWTLLLWMPVVLLLAAIALLAWARTPGPALRAAPQAGNTEEAANGLEDTPAGTGEETGSPRSRGAGFALPGTRMRPVALPSAAQDYDLLFHAVVHWRWAGHVDLSVRNPAALAVRAVLDRAQELARGTAPGDHGRAECDLAAALAVETAATGAGIMVWAEQVRLELPEEDAERLRRMAHLRKDGGLREAIRDADEELTEALEPYVAHTASAGGAPATGEVFEHPASAGPAPVPAVRPQPGSDVDEEGYESYWWPAESGDHESVEEDMRVAILRGMADSVETGPPQAEFVADQVEILHQGGFTEEARRLRAQFPPE